MPAPLPPYRCTVEADWTDYNGHLNVAFYVLVFDRATDAALACCGLDGALRESAGSTVFAAECHVSYQRELPGGAPLAVDTQILGLDDKRVHLFHTLGHAEAGWPAASAEFLLLHVDLGSRRVAPWPPAVHARLAAVRSVHERLPVPAQAGRSVQLRRREPQP
ncbi:thioesterase family protein [Plasticicumulans sp.]|uniref:thioesterase family protein n=1 Tax=Plasticicumulans sp. TaxID=2307179 RepID=UPI003948802A